MAKMLHYHAGDFNQEESYLDDESFKKLSGCPGSMVISGGAYLHNVRTNKLEHAVIIATISGDGWITETPLTVEEFIQNFSKAIDQAVIQQSKEAPSYVTH